MNAEPRAYQLRAKEFILDNPRCALWLEMGLGKTLSTLLAVRDLLWTGEVSRVLVIAPLRVAHHVWPAELKKWDDFRGLTYTILRGAPNWRHTLTGKLTDVHTINYEQVHWLVETRGKDWPYDMIVLDESSRVKSADSQRFKALRKLLKDKPGIRVVQLTGTPSPNGLIDLWAPMFLIDKGARLGETQAAFKQRWFAATDYGPKPKKFAQEQIENKLRDVVVAMRAADYLELPKLIINPISVNMPDKCITEYQALETKFLVELQRVLEHGTQFEKVQAFSAGALTNKCLQYASGAVYLQDELGAPTKDWMAVHDAKLEALEEVVEEAAGSPVLVFYWFKPDLERLRKRFPQGQVLGKSAKVIDDWNAGEIPLLFAHPASAGHGLNLQEGGNICVWFSMQWSLELYQQANARLHRSGQTKPVMCHLLLARGTLDEAVLERLEGKADVQTLLMKRLSDRNIDRAA